MHEDLLQKGVNFALHLGAVYAEARYHRHTSSSFFARNGELVGYGESIEEGIGVRVIVKGALGFSATSSLNWDSLREAVEQAVKLANVHSKFMKKPIQFSEARLGKAKYEALCVKPFDRMDLGEKISYMAEVWDKAKDSVKETKMMTLTARYSEDVEEKTIINSDGAFIVSRVPRLSVGYNFVLLHPQKGTIQRSQSFGGSGGLEQLDKWKVPEAAAEEATKLENVLVNGIEPPKGPLDVIVGSEIVGLIVHESCGHPSEADRIWGREAAQAGMSFVKPGMIGERIGGKYATVIDDPTLPGSYGFYLYDDEGVPARARYLYKEGLINEHLHNRWTASLWGTTSNAAARAMDHNSEPIIRMANTYLAPGDHSFEELLEGVKLGVYMKSYMEWNIDDIRWGQRYVGLECYLIEKGELTKPVRNPVLEVTTKSFYSSIEAAGKELRFEPGTCGKGEPSQGVPVWFGGPDVKLRNIPLGVVG
ncbi:MAG: TldD/PmbA family protein [Thermofilaceae archaeon]|nr:TldD/PmbA family protein [Thermofilaceae archaeon]MCX8180449.1 TldD/PmbA family protein [Thermofilaceae archaeon]MDW8003354.1 TldD/PmbA family protein [Thermofilaceae archaeon]